MHSRAQGASSSAARSEQKTSRASSERGRLRVLRPERHELSSLRLWEHLVADLRKAGLGDEHARAEAARLLAGDVWGG
ncbi:hypothetical protein [Sinomonas humi]|uniref:Uncharacterized protein n=1 Tax=Sinomonas humi TaxID=1338436 RepID=A0A0B2AIR0_9MICC|nr:hypothetical protein [Sinomonas humi]KHL03490.1 hypothetical protein LK10_08610 [Sinomonas humi]